MVPSAVTPSFLSFLFFLLVILFFSLSPLVSQVLTINCCRVPSQSLGLAAGMEGPSTISDLLYVLCVYIDFNSFPSPPFL